MDATCRAAGRASLMVAPVPLQSNPVRANDGSRNEACGYVAQDKHNDQDEGDQDHGACAVQA